MGLWGLTSLGVVACALAGCVSADVTTSETTGASREDAALAGALGQLSEQHRSELANYRFEAVQTARAAFSATPPTLPSKHEAALNIVSTQKISQIGALSPPYSRFSIDDAREGGWRESEEHFFHELSGLSCAKQELLVTFSGDALGIIGLPLAGIQLYKPDGSDTSCNYVNKDNGVYITVYASRWPGVSTEDHFAAALNDMSKTFRLSEEAVALTVSTEPDLDGEEGDDKAPYTSTIEGETKAAAFFIEPVNNQQFKTVLWLNRTGDWHIKMRSTFYAGEKGTASLMGATEIFIAAMFDTKLNEVDRHINSQAVTQIRY